MRHAKTRTDISVGFAVSLSNPCESAEKADEPRPLAPSSVRGNSTRVVLSRAVRRRKHPAHGKRVSLDEARGDTVIQYLHSTHEELLARSEPGKVQLKLRCWRPCASVLRQDRVGKASNIRQAVLMRLI